MRLPELSRSFAGCDGGNIEADLWVCAIEPYGDAGTTDEAQPHLSPRSLEWRHPPSWPPGFAAGLRGPNPPVPAWAPNERSYDFLLATLCWRVFGEAQDPWDYFVHRLYRANGDIFKLNLFPLACREDSQSRWTTDHRERSGCARKSEYVRQVLEDRGPFFRELIGCHKPQVILCTGTGRVGEFRAAFRGDAEPRRALVVDGKTIGNYRSAATGYRLLLSPFLGSRPALLGAGDFVGLAEILRGLLPPPTGGWRQ